jgi:hypothetical protein
VNVVFHHSCLSSRVYNIFLDQRPSCISSRYFAPPSFLSYFHQSERVPIGLSYTAAASATPSTQHPSLNFLPDRVVCSRVLFLFLFVFRNFLFRTNVYDRSSHPVLPERPARFAHLVRTSRRHDGRK